MGEVKAKAGIFCYPLRGARGFVVRLLESRRLMVVYSISVVDDRLLRHARVLASDDLRNTYGHSPRVIRDMVDDVRHMYAAIPGAPMDDFMVRLDPLAPGGVPMRLEAMRSDDFGGEWILDVPADHSDSRTYLAPPHAPLPPSLPVLEPAPTKPAGSRDRLLRAQATVFIPPAEATPRSSGVVDSTKKSSASVLYSPMKWTKWVQRPENKHLTIFVPPDVAKRGKSAARFEKIRGCTTIAEYESTWDR